MGAAFLFSKLFQYLCSPILLTLLFLPIYLYRIFVIILAKFLLPRGSEIIEFRNAMFSPCFSTLSPMGALIAPLIFKGSVDIAQITTSFSTFVKKYRKLSCSPELFWLYCFWVPVAEEDFSLANHIQEIRLQGDQIVPAAPGSVTSMSDFRRLKKLLLQEPFPKGRSPWILYVLRNVQHEAHGTVDVAIVKWHHGLADGISMLKMLGEAVEPRISPPKINVPRIPGWLDVLNTVRALLNVVDCNCGGGAGVGKTVLAPSSAQLKRGNNFFLAESKPVPIELIKGIKNEHSVSFNSVVLAALSSALKSHLVLKGGKETRVPKDVATCIVLPYPGHPDNQLTNYWSWTIIPLPVSSASAEVLTKIFHLIKSGKDKVLKNFRRVPIFGGLPFLFHGGIISPHSVVCSDFPGPTNPVSIWGGEIVDMSFYINIPPSIIALFCTSLSYAGKWKFEFTVDGAMAESQEEADTLANMVAANIIEMAV